MVHALLARVPGRFSSELGLALRNRRPEILFRWFLAAVLFGARISGTIVLRTYREFLRRGLRSPARLHAAGWHALVDALDAGGYARYDFKTATKLLEVSQSLLQGYGGSLNRLHEAAKDSRDLEARLKNLGRGIGDVTVQIFLRELRGVWSKAQPAVSPLARLAADHLGLSRPARKGADPLNDLTRCWRAADLRRGTFADFESALVRLGRDYCRRRPDRCPLREYCRIGIEGRESGVAV